MKRKPKTAEVPDKVEFETFRDLRGTYHIKDMTLVSPSCFNSDVLVRKFRITIELIDEPVEVIQERLKTLFANSKNHHDYEPLVSAGKKYGIELKHTF